MAISKLQGYSLRFSVFLASLGKLLMFSPLLKQLPFAFIVFSFLSEKISRVRLFFAFFLICYFILLSFIFLDTNIKISSFLLAFLTWVSILFVSPSLLLAQKDRFIKFACVSVFVSIFLSIYSLFYSPLVEVRTNTVFLIDRITFFFEEPSHYALFLSYSILCVNFKDANKFILFVLYLGLLLTWSLSGFIFLALIYFLHGLSFKTLFNVLIKVLLCIFAISCFWLFYLKTSDFWIASKISSLLLIFSGDFFASSALYRTQSTLMGFNFLVEKWIDESYFHLFFGLGFGNINDWVGNNYYQNFGISDVEEVNNFFTSVILSNGLFGLLVLVSIFSLTYRRIYPFSYLYLIFCIISVLSLFSGYAFGSTAILFFLLSVMSSIILARSRCGCKDEIY